MHEPVNPRRAALATSYLEHIRIALEADDRGAPFRTFIDNWAAFSSDADHHVSSGDRPKWFNNPCLRTRQAMLYSLDFRSKGSEPVLAQARAAPADYQAKRAAKDSTVRLVVDHAVPIDVMVRVMFDPQPGEGVERTAEGIRAHLSRWYRLGLLTPDEDASLNRAGYRSAMPRDWDRRSVFARYDAVGIVAVDRQLDIARAA